MTNAPPLTAAALTFATTDDTRDVQQRADIVIDVRRGAVLKNRFGQSTRRVEIENRRAVESAGRGEDSLAVAKFGRESEHDRRRYSRGV